MRMKLTALFSLVAVSSAFSPSQTNGRPWTTQLSATIEKGTVTAPSKISDDEAKAIYDENVQTTYG